ncbi:MAG: protein-L-isoaspartate(D-aspartate) O-methyltransferase [Planctomycetota bacterium]
MASERSFAEARENLLEELRAEGISDPRVLDAIRATPRENFVPESIQDRAYENNALSIGHGQTISQPYIVALMTQALQLQGRERVLEIGTGSGYQAAILTKLAREVYSVERLPELSQHAQARIAELGIHNIHFRIGDGTEGWPEHAPYDGILVTAAAPALPRILLDQLAEGGTLVIPVGEADHQVLHALRKSGDRVLRRRLCDCRFVPLIGALGWESEQL